MRRLAVVLLALLPRLAVAQGIDLTWNDCVGSSSAATNRAFSCSGGADETYDLVFQFRLAAPVTSFIGLAAYADYQNSSGAPLTPFWHYESGGCNNPSVGIEGLDVRDDVRMLPYCAANRSDPWDGDGSGGSESIPAYGVDFHRPGNGYLLVADGRFVSTTLVAGSPYYAFHLAFNNRNRATCPGCSDPGVLFFQLARFVSNDGSPDVDLDRPDQGDQCVSVNGGLGSLCGQVPARAMTWARLKSIYR